jgi:hypothetical protein
MQKVVRRHLPDDVVYVLNFFRRFAAMRIHTKIKLLALSLGIALGGAAAANETVYLCATADGGSELSNVDTGNKCEQLVSGTPAADPAAPPAAAADPQQAAKPAAEPAQKAAATTDAAAAEAAAQPPGSRYRDTMLKGATKGEGAPTAALNPAVNRRYLMTNRSAFQQQNGVAAP